MAVTKRKSNRSASRRFSKLLAQLLQRMLGSLRLTPSKSRSKAYPQSASLRSLTMAALALPGLVASPAYAADEDSVDFQYSHYQEGERTRATLPDYGGNNTGPHANKQPITADSIIGKVHTSLSDRLKLDFGYSQDTWSGATPLMSGPLLSVKIDAIGSASPYTPRSFFIDRHGNFVSMYDGNDGKIDNRITHVYASASPETRRQGDLKLTYEWDEMALGIGGGLSEEPDFRSKFFNANARWDFNQKLTTVNFGLSHTRSDIGTTGGRNGTVIQQTPRAHVSGGVGAISPLVADRKDWGLSIGLSQVLSKNTVLNAGMSYTHNAGFLENPYKIVELYFVGHDYQLIDNFEDPDHPYELKQANVEDVWEQRPDTRNQFNWNLGVVQYIAPFDAALHVDYGFSHDDWGVKSHTLSGSWAQPVGYGWTLTPRIRYYSQTAADFYQPYFMLDSDTYVLDGAKPRGYNLDFSKLPIKNFSSDHRLSGYGTLSAGITVSKQLTNGVKFELDYENYKHAGNLKLRGGGEDSFADFRSYTVNAALKVDLDRAVSHTGSDYSSNSHTSHNTHSQHVGQAPSGVLLDHMLSNAGDFMVDYRFMQSRQNGGMLHGRHQVSDQTIIDKGCPSTDACRLVPTDMLMNMHMLEFMYAPTDWLTLMIMPQYMDMDMGISLLENAPPVPADASGHVHARLKDAEHSTAGIGDTEIHAMLELIDNPIEHLHLGLGFSVPTGSVREKFTRANGGAEQDFIHYGMQHGSGTWDFKPSLTYTAQINKWSWGAQISGTKRLQNKNKSGYALGDEFQTTAWGNYNLFGGVSVSLRGLFKQQGSIKHKFDTHNANKLFATWVSTWVDVDGDGNCTGLPEDGCNGVFDPDDVEQNYEYRVVQEPNSISAPLDEPSNSGGRYFDVGFGIGVNTATGNRVSVEWLQPIYTNVNGYQLDRKGSLALNWNVMF